MLCSSTRAAPANVEHRRLMRTATLRYTNVSRSNERNTTALWIAANPPELLLVRPGRSPAEHARHAADSPGRSIAVRSAARRGVAVDCATDARPPHRAR